MMHTAIIADWLVTYGGAEHVLKEVADLFPGSTFHTTVARRGSLGPLETERIDTSPLQRFYPFLGRHEPLLPFMPRAIEAIDLTGTDLVISSSHAVAKGVIVPPSATHVCYCHTPMRYAWEMEDQYLRDFRIPRFIQRFVKRELSRLRRWDLSTAKRVDVFIANSPTTQDRIRRYYGRESIVLPPPVDERFLRSPLASHSGDYYFAIGRMVPYKRFDLLIDVANERKLPLKIAGSGSEFEALKKRAGPTVELLGRVPDDALPGLYAHAKALLFPQEEDAGIVLLEAHACGTPAIAFGKGGAKDALVEGTTGILFAEQTAASLGDAIQRFTTMTFDRQAIRTYAGQFSSSRFREAFKKICDDAVTHRA